MDWKTRGFVALLIVFTIWLGWRYFTRPSLVILPPPSSQPATPTPVSPSSTPDLSNAENLHLLFAAPYNLPVKTASDSGKTDFITTTHPGFVTLFGSGISSKSAELALSVLRDRVGSENMPLVAVDHEGGLVQRLSGVGFTRLPSWQELCQEDTQLRAALLRQSAEELKKTGINIIFAPMVDIGKDNPALGDRLCSDDQEVTAQAATQAVDIYSQAGLMPVLKHYPGIGLVKKDLHTQLDAAYSPPIELAVFSKILNNHPAIGVMVTHVLVKQLSEEAPCSLNPTCVLPLKQANPQVVVFTDALDMKSAVTGDDLQSKKSLSEVAREAVLAGDEVLVFGSTVTDKQLQTVLEDLKIEYTRSSEFRRKADLAITKVQKLRSKVQTQSKPENK